MSAPSATEETNAVHSGAPASARVEYWDLHGRRRAVEETVANRSCTISIVIATLNEEESVTDMVRCCRPYGDEVLVVDGHSTDATRARAEAAGARVILDDGTGKGAALRLAIQEVTGDVIVFIDCDYSHDPADIPLLVAPIIEGRADHVVGSRAMGGSDELAGDVEQVVRLIGSAIITLGINYRFNVRLTDSQCGFRALRTQAARGLPLRENTTTIEQEMTMKSLRAGLRVMDVPTHEYARRHGQSRINIWSSWHRYIYSWIQCLTIG